MGEPFYKQGLRFKCTECGGCCTGAPGYTWVNEEEIATIATHLRLSIEEFGQRYLRKVDDRYALLEDPVNYDCVFLKDKKCSIYAARPTQCRTFPWWPKHLKSPESWAAAASYCEGINHPEAPLISFEKIDEQQQIHREKASF
jgi:uncharacterized protein